MCVRLRFCAGVVLLRVCGGSCLRLLLVMLMMPARVFSAQYFFLELSINFTRRRANFLSLSTGRSLSLVTLYCPQDRGCGHVPN